MNETKSKFTITIIYEENNNNLTQINNYENPPFNIDIPKINELEYPYHYLCTKCLKFPFIEFCKDMKNIKFTCSCYNNKKILIKDLLEEKNKYIFIEDSIQNFLSSINNNSDCQGINCQKHNKKFEYFCKECFIHSCNEINEGNLNNGCDLIRLEEIRFDNKKIELLKNKIKPNIEEINENISNLNDTNTIINNNRNTEILTGKEKNQFNKLINIIINDYNNFPNILHFFNI